MMCNRDERLSRRPAFAPAIDQLRGVPFIAPRDGDHGGAWIGVNQFGLALCLLNRYEDRVEREARAYTSRGLLVKNLLDSSSRIEAQRSVEEIDLREFQPFTLIALDPGERCLMIEWTGGELIFGDGEPAMPLVSSSFDPSGARSARKAEFEKLARSSGSIDARMLMNFHQSHAPARGPLSVCMHRDDARTVSFSHIKVVADSVSFFYFADSPCLADFENVDEAANIEKKKFVVPPSGGSRDEGNFRLKPGLRTDIKIERSKRVR
jgi:hypothetical protein